MKQAKFSIGQCIQHTLFDYRGVIVDVDADFQGSEEWYEQVAKSRPPKDKPWYHVLVDQGYHMTYVAERHLEPDSTNSPVIHPAIDQFFSNFDNGIYRRDQPIN